MAVTPFYDEQMGAWFLTPGQVVNWARNSIERDKQRQRGALRAGKPITRIPHPERLALSGAITETRR